MSENKTRNLQLSDAELLFNAKDALNMAYNITESLSGRALDPAFVRPMLFEAVDAVRVANSALLELQRRSAGVARPKLGD